MNKKGVVFFDVDKTLIDWEIGINEPTEKTRESINKLKENGYLTMLATGRPKNIIRENLITLGLDGIIGSNGAYIEVDKKVILNEYIDVESLKEIVYFFEENKMDYMLEGQKTNYVNTMNNPVIERFLEGEDFTEENLTVEWDIESLEIPKIIVLTYSEEDFNKTKAAFESKGFAFMGNLHNGMFEMYDAKYTKGYGVKKLLEKLDIDKANSYAFGDGENDLEMFQEVKHGIAMGGYFEGLKEFAYDFTEDVKNEGITRGLEKLGLI